MADDAPTRDEGTTAADPAVETSAEAKPATESVAEQVETKDESGKEGEKPAVEEVKYELTLPEGSTVDPAVLERTAATARELGLSQEHAQKMSDLVAAEVAAREAALLDQYKPGGEHWTKQVDDWGAASLADAEIGGTPEKLAENVDVAKKVLATFGSEPLARFLHETGFGSHPEVVRMFAKIGKGMGEGTFVPAVPAGGSTEEDKLRRMYPTMQAQS